MQELLANEQEYVYKIIKEKRNSEQNLKTVHSCRAWYIRCNGIYIYIYYDTIVIFDMATLKVSEEQKKKKKKKSGEKRQLCTWNSVP